MTPEEMTFIFESCLVAVVSMYMIGLGIGLVVKIIKSAVE